MNYNSFDVISFEGFGGDNFSSEDGLNFCERKVEVQGVNVNYVLVGRNSLSEVRQVFSGCSDCYPDSSLELRKIPIEERILSTEGGCNKSEKSKLNELLQAIKSNLNSEVENNVVLDLEKIAPVIHNDNVCAVVKFLDAIDEAIPSGSTLDIIFSFINSTVKQEINIKAVDSKNDSVGSQEKDGWMERVMKANEEKLRNERERRERRIKASELKSALWLALKKIRNVYIEGVREGLLSPNFNLSSISRCFIEKVSKCKVYFYEAEMSMLHIGELNGFVSVQHASINTLIIKAVGNGGELYDEGLKGLKKIEVPEQLKNHFIVSDGGRLFVI